MCIDPEPARWQSLADQLDTVRRALAAAEEGLRLAQQRKEFAVGIVLETIQAEQDLTRARLDYLKTVADFDRTQYALSRATGRLGSAPEEHGINLPPPAK